MLDINQDLLEYKREIRDPIYDYIYLSNLESAIIDTPTFQRLDRIRQMHSVYKVYPSARYSRKVHSLGVMHLCGRAICRLLYYQNKKLYNNISAPVFKDYHSRKGHTEVLDELDYLFSLPEFFRDERNDIEDFKKEKGREIVEDMNLNEMVKSTAWIIQSSRLLGLLHDCGHGPFSHLVENIPTLEFDHEKNAPFVIDKIKEEATKNLEEENREVLHSSIRFVKEIMQKEIIEEVESEIGLEFFDELINSPFDCDMLDYLVRDSHSAGTLEYGYLDVERVINSFVVKDSRIRISNSDISALVNAFESLFYMYKNVYHHKTVRMYDIILQNGLSNIKDYLERDIGLNGEEQTDFVDYDDKRLIEEIKIKAKEEGEEKFEKAKEKIKIFSNREKPYKELIHYPFIVDLDKSSSPGPDPLEEIYERLEETFDEIRDYANELDVEIEIDALYTIRRAGISIQDLTNWASRPLLYDPNYDDKRDAFIQLYQDNPEITQKIKRVEIPSRIFIKRGYSEEKEKDLKEEAKDKFARAKVELEGVE